MASLQETFSDPMDPLAGLGAEFPISIVDLFRYPPEVREKLAREREDVDRLIKKAVETGDLGFIAQASKMRPLTDQLMVQNMVGAFGGIIKPVRGAGRVGTPKQNIKEYKEGPNIRAYRNERTGSPVSTSLTVKREFLDATAREMRRPHKVGFIDTVKLYNKEKKSLVSKLEEIIPDSMDTTEFWSKFYDPKLLTHKEKKRVSHLVKRLRALTDDFIHDRGLFSGASDLGFKRDPKYRTALTDEPILDSPIRRKYGRKRLEPAPRVRAEETPPNIDDLPPKRAKTVADVFPSPGQRRIYDIPPFAGAPGATSTPIVINNPSRGDIRRMAKELSAPDTGISLRQDHQIRFSMHNEKGLFIWPADQAVHTGNTSLGMPQIMSDITGGEVILPDRDTAFDVYRLPTGEVSGRKDNVGFIDVDDKGHITVESMFGDLLLMEIEDLLPKRKSKETVGDVFKPTGKNPISIGKDKFWALVVDENTGKILQKIKYKDARDADFHHSLYVKSSLAKRVDSGKARVVWDSGDGLQSMEPLPDDLKLTIEGQLSKIVDIFKKE